MVEVTNREEKFNINDILKNVFLSLQKETDCNHCEIVYAMDKTVPKMFRGNARIIEDYLLKVFYFIAKINQKDEILVAIHGPKEFVYTDDIILTIKNIKLTEEEIKSLQKDVDHTSSILGAKINTYSSTTLTIRLPLMVLELGTRRQYRLPSKSLLQKNVLIIAESKNITLSITKMFKYFPYNVDMGMEKYQDGEYDLSQYNLIVVEDKLMTENLDFACNSVQKSHKIKVVILGNMKSVPLEYLSNITSVLAKPVTQESIFELIISVFSDEYDSNNFLETGKKEKKIAGIRVNKQDILNGSPTSGTKIVSDTSKFEKKIKETYDAYATILDTRLGKKNTKKLRLYYDDELENFFDMFDGSDLYFRQIVNEKSLHKIKEFCIDLEKYSKIIGAQSMLQFTEAISLMFVYRKTDSLPIYPGRYHIELKKLFKEMEHYFS